MSAYDLLNPFRWTIRRINHKALVAGNHRSPSLPLRAYELPTMEDSPRLRRNSSRSLILAATSYLSKRPASADLDLAEMHFWRICVV